MICVMCFALRMAHTTILCMLLFALFCASQIDYITLRAFVNLDTGIIENYWGCILRQLASVKLSVQVNFYLTKIRAEPYKNN
jgi:hypothetical protein